ncbi:MAG TPA: twin-arginine translocation signal domain-containing protein [Terracidiphilus sp.]|nr:twin-arginine translocation signal domain-containing protein [Terracidiphilus sp.]
MAFASISRRGFMKFAGAGALTAAAPAARYALAQEAGASISFGNYTNFTRRGNTLYIHVYFWPSETPAAQWLPFFRKATVVAVGGLDAKVLSARLLKTGQKLDLHRTSFRCASPACPVSRRTSR